jgi:translation initiation factor IF-2
MAGVLLKIAKEFNVGTTTVVDHLLLKGFAIENKPNAKISDEMYAELLKEFKSSADIKEKADQLQIGNSFKKQDDKPTSTAKPDLFAKLKGESSKPKEETLAPPVQEPKKEEPKEEVIEAKAEVAGLKVVGKIDLDKPKTKKTGKKEEAPVAKEQPSEKQEVKEETPSLDAVPVEEASTAPLSPTVEEIVEYRAETPQLQGLKIMGMIDTSKFGPQPKSAKKDNAKDVKGGKPAVTPVAKSDNQTSEEAKKRKRKRK